ncbi:MAG TPA: hypothetical protein VHD33_06060, partial [Legionellaceae bacterium]|nr:hypothetical protein [Legionellaceae bacterium]
FFHCFSALWPHLTILDENGKLYLRRFFFTPKTKWYRPRFLHYIGQSDSGRDPHDHPGPFTTKVLSGGYVESVYFPKQYPKAAVHSLLPGMKQYNPEGHTHKVDLIAPTWSWVIGWIRGKPWGFWLIDPINPLTSKWIDSEQYGNKGVEIKSWQ